MTKRAWRKQQEQSNLKPGVDHALDSEQKLCVCGHLKRDHTERTIQKEDEEWIIAPCLDCKCKDFNSTEFGRDGEGRLSRGLAGISDARRAAYIRTLLFYIDYHIAHADDPRAEPPGIDIEAACRQARLTQSQQDAMVPYLQGYSMQQVANRLGITKSAVQHRVHLSRPKLKAYFSNVGLDIVEAV